MFHDYFNDDKPDRFWVDSIKNQEVKCTGFMDVPITNEDTNTVIEAPNKWSGCSVHDFRTAFKHLKWDETCFVENIPQGNIETTAASGSYDHSMHHTVCPFNAKLF